MIQPDAHLVEAQATARREAIRSLLLVFMFHSVTKPDATRYPALEDVPWDIILQVRIGGEGPWSGSPPDRLPLVAEAAMTPEAYFALLVEFDLIDAHRYLHLNGKTA